MRKLILGAGGLFLGYNFYNKNQTWKDIVGLQRGFLNSFSAVSTVALSIYDYQYELSKYEYNSDEYHEKRKQVASIHQRVAERILKLSQNNRGVYLKAGQYIGNLERVMPKEYTDTLKVLQDQGPSVPFSDIKIVLEYDLKRNFSEMFSTFNEQAIAAASLAQVHEATLLGTNEKVAVKVQFPTLRTQYRYPIDQTYYGHRYDLIIIQTIAKLTDFFIELNGQDRLDFYEISQTFRKALLKELDFLKEAKNGKITAEQFRGIKSIYIPKYFDEFQSERILVMEFVNGVKINDIEGIKKLNLKTIDCANILINTVAKMIFETGHVHCDAHPGNILIRNHPQNMKKPQLILLDHGFYTDIESEKLETFCNLWISLSEFDYQSARMYAEKLGISEKNVEQGFKQENNKKDKEERKYLFKKELISLQNLTNLIKDLPEELMFVIRAANLSGIHNAILGGNTRMRLKKFTKSALKRKCKQSKLLYYWHLMLISVRLFLIENFYYFFPKQV